MPSRCFVSGCSEISENNLIQLYRFPKDANLVKEWINACKRRNLTKVVNGRICSKHFSEEQYDESVKLKYSLLKKMPLKVRLLKKNAVPDINLPMTDKGKVKSRLSLHAVKGCSNTHHDLGSSFKESRHFSSPTNTSAVGNEGSLEVVEVKEEQELQKSNAEFDVKTDSTLLHNEDKIETIVFVKVEPKFSELGNFNIKTEPTTWDNDKFETTLLVKKEPKLLELDSIDIKTEQTILNAPDNSENVYACGGGNAGLSSKRSTSAGTHLASRSVLGAKGRRSVTSSH